MAENTPGVIAQARAQAPAAGQQPAPQPAQPAPQPALVAEPQGFGAPPAPNGFAPQPIPQPVAPVEPAIPDTRTQEQFSKLTETNQRLSQQTQTLAQQNESLRQELQRLQTPQQQNVPTTQPAQQPFAQQQQGQQSAMPNLNDYIEIDSRTGERFVNEAKFNAAVADIYQKAARAEQTVQQYVQTSEQREIARQNREAYSSYPQLNPQGGQFDQRFAQQTRAIAFDSMVNPQDYGGRSLGVKEAADFIAQAGTAGTQRAVTQAIQPPSVNEANQVLKEQAAAVPQSTPQQVSTNIDQEREYQRQVEATRLGDDRAIAVRLLNATHRMEDVDAEVR